MAIRGSCLCGAVSYKITGSLGVTGHCHCSICRKSHGAAFAMSPTPTQTSSDGHQALNLSRGPNIGASFRCLFTRA